MLDEAFLSFLALPPVLLHRTAPQVLDHQSALEKRYLDTALGSVCQVAPESTCQNEYKIIIVYLRV